MHAHHAVFDLAAIPIVLPSHRRRVVSTFVNARFVDEPHRLGMGVFLCDDLLTTIAQQLFLPLDRFEKTL